MKKEFCTVTLDLSKGSAYEFRKTSEIPTVIKYGRQFSGKFQTGKVTGNFTNDILHNLIYFIKRGIEIENIEKYAKIHTVNEK